MLSITLENNMLISYDLTNSESHFFLIGPNICCSLCQKNQRSNQKNSKFTIRNSKFGRSFGEEHKKRVTIVEKSCVCMTVHNTPTPIDAKLQTKNPVKWQKCHEKFPTALCACWHLAR